MGKRIKGPTPQRRQRMRTALKLREAGTSYAAIGEQLGVATKTAWEDVQDALKEITREPAEQLLTLELARIDERERVSNSELAIARTAIRKVLKEAEEGGYNTPVKQLAPLFGQVARLLEAGVKIAGQRQRLLGLDQGIHVDATVDVTRAINDFLRPFSAEEEAAMMGEDVE